MKRFSIIICLSLALSIALCACSANTNETRKRESEKPETEETTTIEETTVSEETTTEETTTTETENDVDAHNRTIVAEVLQINEDDYCLPYLLAAFEYLETGYLQSAELVCEDDLILDDDEYFLYFTAEDGTEYRMILSSSYSNRGVQNIDTGEWVMRSIM